MLQRWVRVMHLPLVPLLTDAATQPSTCRRRSGPSKSYCAELRRHAVSISSKCSDRKLRLKCFIWLKKTHTHTCIYLCWCPVLPVTWYFFCTKIHNPLRSNNYTVLEFIILVFLCLSSHFSLCQMLQLTVTTVILPCNIFSLRLWLIPTVQKHTFETNWEF